MVLAKQQDMQLEAGYFGNHGWFLDVHTPPGLFSCKPSKATAGKWISSCKASTHYAETKPFLGAAKHLLSCEPPEAMQSFFSLHHGFNRESPFFSLTFTFIFQIYLFFRCIYFSRPIWTMLSSMPDFSGDRDLGTHKWEWYEILSNYIWYQASWKFIISRLDCAVITCCLSTYAHEESHKHQ